MSLGEIPLVQVKALGKLYTRRPRDMRRKLGDVAWKAFFNTGKHSPPIPSGSGFWAVQNISFDLQRGSALGIIGLNGSGKTTMLRMLAGQLMPDAGEIVVNGSSAAMIDLQAGFQSSASGHENIFLRAAALGFSREETIARLEEIIAFSELGDAINAPLSTYSAGMRMRLAFAVMTIVSPDLLLIDEVLAVGDFRFRQKCLAKVREMRDRSAFVFVSHSMGDVRSFCDHVIVMHKGQVYFEGAPQDAIEVYETLEAGTPAVEDHQKVAKAMGPQFHNEEAITDVSHMWCDPDGNPASEMPFGSPFHLRVKFKSLISMRHLIIGVPVWALNTHYTTGLSTQINSDEFNVQKGEVVDLKLEVDGGYINPGVLKSMLSINDGPEFLFREPNPNLVIQAAQHPTWGAVTVPHRWSRVGDRPIPRLRRPQLVRKGG